MALGPIAVQSVYGVPVVLARVGGVVAEPANAVLLGDGTVVCPVIHVPDHPLGFLTDAPVRLQIQPPVRLHQ